MLSQALGSLPYRMQLLGGFAWRIAGAPQHPIDEASATSAISEASRVTYRLLALPTWHSLNTPEQHYLRALHASGGGASAQRISQAADLAPTALSRAKWHLENLNCVRLAEDGTIELGDMIALDDLDAIVDGERQHALPTDETEAVSGAGMSAVPTAAVADVAPRTSDRAQRRGA